jgi:hypothetical protein
MIKIKKFLLLFLTVISLASISPNIVFATCGTISTADYFSESNVPVCRIDKTDNRLGQGATKCEGNGNETVCCINADQCPEIDTNQNSNNSQTTFEFSELIKDGPNNDFFDSLNPLKLEGNNTIAADLSTPGGIVSRLLLFLFPIAGLILFAMIVWGGFEILSGSVQGSKGIEAGKNRITAAIVGFLLLFATYWMAQIIEVIFGILIV